MDPVIAIYAAFKQLRYGSLSQTLLLEYPPPLLIPYTMPTWQELAADKKKRQAEAIPKEWIITLPPAEQLDVTDFPVKSGLLSPFEVEVTESTDVADILEKLASGVWSSVNVTRAYYKRAIIAQQLVRPFRRTSSLSRA